MQEVSSQAIFNQNQLVQTSIVIPVYNQERHISVSLRRIKEILDSKLFTYELIIVNDGSYDNTLEIITKEQESDPRLRVISYRENRGKGHAVKAGIEESRGDLVVFLDGDLDISPSMIKHYVEELQNCDLVIGSKRHPLSNVDVCLTRRLLSRIFSIYVRVVAGMNIKDTQSGLKAGRGDILRSIFEAMQVRRYAFDVELLKIASLLNLSIKELPVDVTIDRRFKLHDIAEMFLDVMSITYRYRIKKSGQKQLKFHKYNRVSKIENT